MTEQPYIFNLKNFIDSCEACLSVSSLQHQQKQIAHLFCSALGSSIKRQNVLADLKEYARDNFPSQQGAYILKQSPQLFLSIFTLSSKMRTAIHNHGLWTTVAILRGSSQCQFYKAEPNQNIQQISSKLFTEGDVYTISGEEPHDVYNPTNESTIELHFYPGDVLTPQIDAMRSLWHPLTLIEEPYILERSLQISREVSQARKD